MRRLITAFIMTSGGVCAADTVLVDYRGHGELGGFVAIDYVGFMPYLPDGIGPVWAGQNQQVINGRTTTTFGLDVLREAGPGGHAMAAPDNAFDQPTADALHALYNATGGRVDSSDQAVAFQAVLWELVTDFRGEASGVDLHSGSLVFKDGVDQGLFDAYKAMAFDPKRSTGDSSLRVLSHEKLQPQAVVIESVIAVPLPSGAALAIAGLALVARRRVRA